MTQDNRNVFVLYHANCSDGKGAALAAWLKFGDQATYIAVQYGQHVPQLPTQAHVFILDFSYKREVLQELKEQVASLMVLDHHKSAMEDLKDLPYAKFDMTKSGAVMAWEYFHPDQPLPELYKLIQDYDLWKWELTDTGKVAAALEMVPNFVDLSEYVHDTSALVTQGQLILKVVHEKTINSAERKAVVNDNWFTMINGYPEKSTVAVVNLTSDNKMVVNLTAERIYKNYDIDFVALFQISSEGRVIFSLRSNPKKDYDVSVQAMAFGGGGHRNAAAFSTSLIDGAKILELFFTDALPLEKFKLSI
jgi:oligoribonuclease NrnB/cAMP/cGMP phosphodiesterase (DHH superfamily)